MTTANEYTKRWRAKNPEWVRATNRRAADKRRARLDALKDAPCVDCGGTFPPECMDFDHVRGPKLFNVGHYVNGGQSPTGPTPASAHGASLDRLMAEIAKCDLVCANCHRIRTKRRRTTA